MPFNTSPMINDTFNTIFSPYTDLFSNLFWLIPLTFIAVALYTRTRSLPAVFGFLVASCTLLAGGNMFIGSPEIAFLYFMFSALALVGLVLSVLFIRR